MSAESSLLDSALTYSQKYRQTLINNSKVRSPESIGRKIEMDEGGRGHVINPVLGD